MYKVFIDEKAFFLVFNIKKLLRNDNVKIIKKNKIDKVLKVVKKTDKTVFVNFKSHKSLQKWISKEFKVISAGGGLVLNEKDKVLLIYRNDKWDLPKGKIEKGEGKKKAAVREVEEECGITAPDLDKHIITTYHIYSFKGELVLKESFWYLMHYEGNEKLIPQEEEGITEVKWAGKKQLKKALKNTYPSIIDVFEEYNSKFN